MTQYKIIDIRGQCRGRPPTRGPNKDRPLAVVQLDNWTVPPRRDLRFAPIGQLDIELPEAGLWKSGTWSRGSPGDPVIKRRCEFTVMTTELQHINSRLRTKDSKFPLSRDWPTHTCSVKQNIAQNRDNDRLTTASAPGKKRCCGRVVSGSRGKELERWNNGTVEH